MTFIDTNCLLGRPTANLVTWFDRPDDLLREMDNIGIAKAFVTGFRVMDTPSFKANLQFVRDVLAHGERLLPCWSIAAFSEEQVCLDRDALDVVSSEDVRIARVMLDASFPMPSPKLEMLADKLTSLRKILYLEIRTGPGLCHTPVAPKRMEQISAFAGSFPDLKIILFSQKLGACFHKTVDLLRHNPNIYLDISSCQYWNALESLTHAIGSDRLLFGSYMPYFDAGQFVVELACADIQPADRKRIAHTNAEMLLNSKQGSP